MKKTITLVIILLTMACKKDDIEDTSPYSETTYSLQHKGIIKKQWTNDAFFILAEELSPLLISPGHRILKKVSRSGVEQVTISSEQNETMIDFDIENEDLFILYSSHDNIKLKKYDINGVLKGVEIIWENTTGTLCATQDRGRICIYNQSVVVAIRPEDYSTRLFSLKTSSLELNWSTLIEPSQDIFGIGMNGGSYDTFEQLAHRYMVFIDIDQDGNIYTVIPALYSSSIYWHNIHFSENLSHNSALHVSSGLETDALVTKVSPTGSRVYTVVAGSMNPNECYGIKANKTYFFLYGRTAMPSNSYGFTWNPYIGKYNANTGSSIFVKNYYFEQSGIVYDLTETQFGNIIIVGSKGWSQNPLGFSVSESSKKLVAVLDPSGQLLKEVDVESGLRHNQVRSLLYKNNKIWISGWENGPGTHSGDGNMNLVYADAFLKSYEMID